MDHKEYLQLKEKVEKYEKDQTFLLPSIKEYLTTHLTNKYKEILTSFDIVNEKNRQNKLIITIKYTVLDSSNYTVRQSFSPHTNPDIITKSLLSEVEEHLNSSYIYYKLKEQFKTVNLSMTKSIITCSSHNKFKHLIVKINLIKRTITFVCSYKINETNTMRVNHTIAIDELRLCGNTALGLSEQIEEELKHIKTIKLNLI